MSDDDIARLIDDFVEAAKRADRIGFSFVDVKHCHGYLGHEFLSAVDRPGKYGGSLENRTRFLREIVAGIRAEAPRSGDRRPRQHLRFFPVQSRDPTARAFPQAMELTVTPSAATAPASASTSASPTCS